MVIHPILNIFTIRDFTINCNREARRISCMIADFYKMDKIIIKQARNKKSPSVVFLISLQFAEDLASVQSYFGEQFDQQLKKPITEIAETNKTNKLYPNAANGHAIIPIRTNEKITTILSPAILISMSEAHK